MFTCGLLVRSCWAELRYSETIPVGVGIPIYDFSKLKIIKFPVFWQVWWWSQSRSIPFSSCSSFTGMVSSGAMFQFCGWDWALTIYAGIAGLCILLTMIVALADKLRRINASPATKDEPSERTSLLKQNNTINSWTHLTSKVNRS